MQRLLLAALTLGLGLTACGNGQPTDADGGDGGTETDGADATEASDDADAGDADAPEDRVDDAGDAETIGDVETREGGSPGVMCRKVPAPTQTIYSTADGDGSRIVFAGFERRRYAPPRVLDWRDGIAWRLDDFSDVAAVSDKSVFSQSEAVDGDRVAYDVSYYSAPEETRIQLRIADLALGTHTQLVEGTGTAHNPCTIDFINLDYPWVVWRQVSEETYHFGWVAYQMNLETATRGEVMPRQSGVVNLDLLDTTAVVSTAGTVYSVDITTGAQTELAERGPPDQWGGTITSDWIVWLDQRAYPECDWSLPCGTQVWGKNRTTGETVPLVTDPWAHGPEIDGEGDWIVYADHRGEADPWHSRDRVQNVYALHLPTMTEVCVENWPGLQYRIRAYTGEGGETRVLFFEELSLEAYDLWDCNLPTPTGGK